MHSSPILLALLPFALAAKPIIDFGGPETLASDGPIILPEAAETSSSASNSIITSVNPGGGISISTSSGTGSTSSPTSGTTITSVQPGGGISVSTQVSTTPDTTPVTGVSSFQPGGPIVQTSSSHLSLGPGPVLSNSTFATTTTGSGTGSASGATGTGSSATASVTGGGSSGTNSGTSDAVAARVDLGIMAVLAGVVGVMLM